MGNAALALPAEEFLVPDESVLSMIEACAAQIERATTMPDVKRMLMQAEAIYAVTQKIKAAENIKANALRLLVDAETQLGRITKTLPQGKKGGAAVPGQTTKRMLLKAHGINRYRASIAEKYADTPKPAITTALTKARTLNETSVALGFKKAPFVLPEKRARDLAYLANEAITLLERCASQKIQPHSGTVSEMRTRLSQLSVIV